MEKKELKRGLKVATTSDIIRLLQEYEKENGVGAIVGISTHMEGDRENQYCFEIANDSDSNKICSESRKDHYKRTKIEIPSINDEELFPPADDNIWYN